MILHLTEACSKNAINLDFSGDISVPKCLLFCNVNIPLYNYPLNQLCYLIICKKEECLFL